MPGINMSSIQWTVHVYMYTVELEAIATLTAFVNNPNTNHSTCPQINDSLHKQPKPKPTLSSWYHTGLSITIAVWLEANIIVSQYVYNNYKGLHFMNMNVSQ